MCRLSEHLLVHVRRCGLPLKIIHWLNITQIHRDFLCNFNVYNSLSIN